MQTRPTLVALAACACFMASAQATIFTYDGDTTAAPTFNRPLEDLSALSAVGTAVAYNTFNFSVDTSGSYTFLTTAEFDPFTFLYLQPFNPAVPLGNALIANDDLLGLTTSGFAYDLVADTGYAVVVTGFANTDLGKFSTTIGGPGAVTPAVPEPQTYALMLLGLGALGFARRLAAARSA